MNKLKHTLMLVVLLLIGNVEAQTTCLRDSSYYYNAANVLTSKYFYTYNSSGLQTEQLVKDSLNGVWKNQARYLYSYSATGKQTEFVQQNWVNNSWRNAGKQVTSYTANDDVATNNSYFWDTLTASWYMANYQFNYTYNSNNDVETYIQAFVFNGNVTDSSRYTYVYDGNGNELSNLREGWTATNPVWRNIQKFAHTYNGSNQKDSTFNMIWNDMTQVFDLSFLTLYQYDGFGNTSEYLNMQRMGMNWVNSSKQSYTYDSNNQQIEYAYFNWQTATNTWLETQRNTTEYNAQNNPTYQLGYNYNSTTGTLDSLYQTFYTYDANDNVTWLDSYTLNSNTSTWDLSYKMHNFFDCSALGLTDFSDGTVQCYPNPATDQLTVVLPTSQTMSIVSLSGEIMGTFSGEFVHHINLTDFPAGCYFIQCGSQHVKFMKQ